MTKCERQKYDGAGAVCLPSEPHERTSLPVVLCVHIKLQILLK